MAGYGLRPITGDLATMPPKWFPVADAYATADIFTGDFVERLATGYVTRQNDATGETPTTTNVTLGVAVGFRYMDANGIMQFRNYLPASSTFTRKAVLVCQDPNQLYVIQANGNITFADVGLNAPVTTFASSSGSTVTGNSGIVLDQTNIATTNTLALRIIDVVKNGSNEYLTTGKDVIVKILAGCLQDSIATGL